MEKNSTLYPFIRKYWLLWLPPVVLLLCAVFFQQVLWLEQYIVHQLFPCPLHTFTGLYCPGCGGTRSLTALLHGDLLTAVRDNPLVPAIILLLILRYIEQIAALFGRTLRIIPRQRGFWYAAGGVVAVWAVCRNLIPALMPSLPLG